VETLDRVCGGLHALLRLTNDLCNSLERGQLQELDVLIQKREEILQSQLALTQDFAVHADKENGEVSRFTLLLERLQEHDRQLGDLLSKKKEEVAQKLKRASNQKRFLMYSR
jgi:hypothetical protein